MKKTQLKIYLFPIIIVEEWTTWILDKNNPPPIPLNLDSNKR